MVASHHIERHGNCNYNYEKDNRRAPGIAEHTPPPKPLNRTMTTQTDIRTANELLPFICMIEVSLPNLRRADRDFLQVMKCRCLDHRQAVSSFPV